MLNWHALEVMRQERYDVLRREAERQRQLRAVLASRRSGARWMPQQFGWLLIRLGSWLMVQGARIQPYCREALPSAPLAAHLSTSSSTFWRPIAPSNSPSRNGHGCDGDA